MVSTTKRLLVADSNGPRGGAASEGPAAKKPRKKAVTAKSLGLTQEEFNRIKAAPIKKTLKAIANKLGRQVDADWHDGYEEQAETKAEWFEAIQEPLQAVLDIGVGKKTALIQCNEVLKIVSDSFYDLLACPCRCDTIEEFADMDLSFELKLPWGGTFTARCRCPYDIWSYVWVALLRTHAAKKGLCGEKTADDTLLLRCIKDASDNMKGAELMELPGFLYDENEDDFDESNLKDGRNAPDGATLAKLIEDKGSEWKSLDTTKKRHKMRRAIDRRFDGSPSRRTRNYGSDDDGDCIIS